MINKNYKVNRDNIFVGTLVETDRIYRRRNTTKLSIKDWFNCRNMLFIVDEKGHSNDLLYKSPSYPILNITSNREILKLKDTKLVIKDACNLASLLEYFNFNEKLTYQDIVKIRNTFFTGHFAMDNAELFGYKEDDPINNTYYKNGEKVTNPRKIKRIVNKKLRERTNGIVTFYKTGEGILSEEYWTALDERDKFKVSDLLHGRAGRIDSFKPSVGEDQIKKLRRK